MGKSLDKAGFQTGGYITKKGTPVTMGAQMGYIFNRLPPGMNIKNQDTSDQRAEPFKQLVETSGYPGDGWSGSSSSVESLGSQHESNGTVKGGS